ncbi:CDR ABC transporter [Phytophthora cactorum]|nr:CDR ABC transporter [Phytophthora cactorum]
MERHHDNPAVGNPTANSDTDDNQSVGDVVPEMNPQVSTYRLPRFSSRRLSSSSSMGDYDRLPRTKSMFPEPQQLTKDDLTSADALMADGVFTMNSTLSTQAARDQMVYNQMPKTPKQHQNVIEIHNVDDVLGGVPTISVPAQPNGRGISDAPPTIGDMTLKQYVEDTFDMKHDDIWRNAMILIILIVAFRVLALISLRYISHLKR